MTSRSAQDRTGGSQVKPGCCACGCGNRTALGKIAAVRARSQVEIAGSLGVSRDYVKRVLRDPPRFVLGHQHLATMRERMLRRAETLERKAAQDRLLDLRIQERRHWKNYARMSRTDVRTRALAADLRAFDLRVTQAFLPSLQLPSSADFAQAVRVQTRQRREWDRDQVEWLRNQVGVGWRLDAPVFDPKLLYLEGLDWKGEKRYHGDAGWWEDREQLDPFEMLQERAQNDAASLMLASSDPLVTKAVAAPESLTPEERAELRNVLEVLEGTQMAPVAVSSEWYNPVLKVHFNHGLGTSPKSIHKKQRSQALRQQGKIWRNPRQVRQKYRPVDMAS